MRDNDIVAISQVSLDSHPLAFMKYLLGDAGHLEVGLFFVLAPHRARDPKDDDEGEKDLQRESDQDAGVAAEHSLPLQLNLEHPRGNRQADDR